jgi:hypothetical protein
MTIRPVILTVLTIVLVAGCGTGDITDSYTLVTVTGTVTLDGKPLEGAQVTFTPAQGTKPDTPGTDRTGKQGNYKAMYRGRSGLAPGKYAVIVSKMMTSSETTKLPDELKDDPALAAMATEGAMIREANRARAERRKPSKVIINASFEREVAENGSVLDFDVKSTD